MASNVNKAIRDREELERFKTDVDLVRIIQKNGYDIDHAKTTSRNTVLKNENTGSVISVTTKKNGHWVFNDFQKPLAVRQTGTVIDFLQQYNGMSIGQIRQYLRPEIGQIHTSYNQVNQQKKPQSPSVSQDHFSFYKIRNTLYLNQRGITNETIFSPMFENRVGQKNIVSNSDKKFTTTVFPMFKNITGKVVGLEIKNNLFTGSYQGSNKKEGFWRSNPMTTKPDLYLNEAPVDSMAHYQIRKNDNAFYISTNGELGANRLEILKNYIEKRKERFNSFNLAMDNDAAGVKFNINVIGNVDLKETNLNIKITAQSDKHLAMVKVISSDMKDIQSFQEDLQHINNKMELTSNYELQYRDISVKSKDGKHTLVFYMNNRKEVLKPIEELALTHRNSPFTIDRAQGKDFGNDLETKLGITRHKVEYGVDKNGKTTYKSVWKNPQMNKGTEKDKDQEKEV